MKDTNINNYGLGAIEVLQIVFIVLKLCKIISWAWWVVLLPLEIETVAIIAILLFVLRWRHK